MSKKKLFKISAACAGMLVGLGLVGNAFAISNITRAGNPTTTIAREIIDPSAGYVHNAAGDISFTVDSGIAAGKKLVVSISGGTFENINKLNLCASNDTPVGTLSVTSTDKTRAEFTVGQNGMPAGGYYIAESCTTPHSLVIKINPGVSAVAVTVATDDTTETNPQRTNPNFYAAQQQFAMSAGNSIVWEIIDVEKDLLKFEPRKIFFVPDTETVAYYDNWATGLTAVDTNPDIKAVIYANVNVNFEVTGKMAGISSMKLVDTKGTPDTDDDKDIATFTIDYANNKATASMKLSTLITGNVAIKLTVDGSTPLEDRTFSINAKLSPADDVKVGTTLIDATATADVEIKDPSGIIKGYIARGRDVWRFSINGLQFVAPYVRQDATVTSAIRVENAANRDSKVWIFVNNGGAWSLVNSYDLPKGDKLVLSGQKIIDDAKAKGIILDGTKGFAVWGVVKGEARDNKNITVYGSQQMVGGSFRPLPIQVQRAIWY